MVKHLQVGEKLECDSSLGVKLVLDDVLNHHPVARLQCGIAEVRDDWEL